MRLTVSFLVLYLKTSTSQRHTFAASTWLIYQVFSVKLNNFIAWKFSKKYRWSWQPSTMNVYHKSPAIRWVTLHFRNPGKMKISNASETPECELCTELFQGSGATLAEASTLWMTIMITHYFPFTCLYNIFISTGWSGITHSITGKSSWPNPIMFVWTI